jgi:heme-degrading monooxygenase HmoA
MYARRVSMTLKQSINRADFAKKMENEIIPLLSKQKGFQDEITFVVPTGRQVFGVSLWDRKEDADAYNSGPYAEVTKILSPMVEGPPQVEAYEVVNSTVHKIASALKAA